MRFEHKVHPDDVADLLWELARKSCRMCDGSGLSGPPGEETFCPCVMEYHSIIVTAAARQAAEEQGCEVTDA